MTTAFPLPLDAYPAGTGHAASSVTGSTAPAPLSELCLPPPADLPEAVVEKDEFKIRLADTAGRRSSASLLVRRMYAWRGYDTEGPPGETSNMVTLVAHTNDTAEQAVGTITLFLDSPAGLPADAAYADKLDTFRRNGRKLCEPGSLAVDPEAANSRALLAALFHLAYMYAHNVLGCTDILLQVNPRHVLFYQRMMGFTEIGEERICPKVNAPAMLLWVTVDHMAAEIAKQGGQGANAGKRSLYPHFFSQKEEAGLTNRLWSDVLSSRPAMPTKS